KANLDLSCWENVAIGAEPIRASTIKRFTETFSPYGFKAKAFFPCYGLAEATLIATGEKSKLTRKTTIINVSREAFQNHKIEYSDEDNAQTLVSSGPSIYKQ